MTYIIAEPCVGTCDTACVEVCPVDCIHGPDDKTGAGAEAKEDGFDPEGKQLYIDPEECIDCGACEPECPVEAIKSEDDVSDNEQHFIELNAELSLQWPVINEMKDPPEGADDWKDKANKLEQLER